MTPATWTCPWASARRTRRRNRPRRPRRRARGGRTTPAGPGITTTSGGGELGLAPTSLRSPYPFPLVKVPESYRRHPPGASRAGTQRGQRRTGAVARQPHGGGSERGRRRRLARAAVIGTIVETVIHARYAHTRYIEKNLYWRMH